MLLKDFLDQFKLIEITAHVSGSSTPPLLLVTFQHMALTDLKLSFLMV
jgi:hypothetical protein